MGPIAKGLGEIFMYTVEAVPGSGVTPTELRSANDWIIKPQLRTVKGVVEVNTVGGFVREVQVAPDLRRLSALQITLDELINAIERNNANVGAGYIERSGEIYLVRVPGQIRDLDEIGAIPVVNRNGVVIRVRDLAAVQEGRELRTGAGTEDGEEVVLGTVIMLTGDVGEPLPDECTALVEHVVTEPFCNDPQQRLTRLLQLSSDGVTVDDDGTCVGQQRRHRRLAGANSTCETDENHAVTARI